MHKLYAVDLIAMEEKLEELEAERKRIESLPAIMRRLKQGRVSDLDKEIHDMGWKIASGKEEVMADPTSTSIYEAEKKRKREKASEASKDAEDEMEP